MPNKNNTQKNFIDKDEINAKNWLRNLMNQYVEHLCDLTDLAKNNIIKVYCLNCVFIFDNLISQIYQILYVVSKTKNSIKNKDLDHQFFESLTYDFVLKIHNLDIIIFHFFGITLKEINPFFERCERLYFICANKIIFQACVFTIRKNREIIKPDAENFFFNRLHNNNYKNNEIDTIPINLREVFDDKKFFNFLLDSFKSSKNFLNCFIPNKNQINFFNQIKKFDFIINNQDYMDEFFASACDNGMGIKIKFDNQKQEKNFLKKISSLPSYPKNEIKPSKECRYRVANSLEKMCLKIIKGKSNKI